MMWNTRYGLMGDFGSRVSPMTGGTMMSGGWNGWYGTGKVATTAQAVAAANTWLASASAGEQVASDAGGMATGKFPGYYSFDTRSTARPTGCSPSTRRPAQSGTTAGTAHS